MGLTDKIKKFFGNIIDSYKISQTYHYKELIKKDCSKVSPDVFYDKKNDKYYHRIEHTDYFKLTKVTKHF